MSVDLRGLWVPVVTPFTADDDVDVDALARLAGRLLDDGATGLVVLGTTGEPATLTATERRTVVETCAGVCRDRSRPFIVGAGTNSTRATIDEVGDRAATVPDAAALLVVVPYYTRPSAAGIVDHYRAVAAASPLPIVAYNIPYRTGRGLGADALLALAAIPNVLGVKQAVGALDRDTLAVLRDRPAGFHVLAGDDAYVAPLTLMGGAGAIAASANLRTPELAALVAAGLAGDVATARALAGDLLETVDAGFAEPSPAVFKAALAARGEIASGHVRAPLTSASAAATAALLATLDQSASATDSSSNTVSSMRR
jgi:4-hydroxy-tetrahydrodipicolinate synthase